MTTRFPALAALFALAAPALAQTGPQLLLKPWPKEQAVEAAASATFLDDGHTDAPGIDARLSLYESSGRLRILPGNLVSPRLGYDFTLIDIHSSDPRLPDQLWDQSVAIGAAIGQFDGWVAGLSLGVGYSGDTPFGNENGFYGKATLGIGKELSKNSILGIVIDYDGNRSIFPDIPLIGVQYAFQLDPKVRLVVGFPVNSVTWTPDETFELTATYSIPDNFGAKAAWRFIPHLWLYGEFDSFAKTFHIDSLPGNDRLFFNQNRVELGLRYQPIDTLTAFAGVGYAFGQEFSTGWNSSNSDTLTDLSDEPYLRAGLQFNY